MTLSHLSTPTHVSEVLPSVVPSKHRTIDSLIQEFEEHEALENPDAVLPMKNLSLTSQGTLAVPTLDGAFAFTDWSKRQLASIVGVQWNRWFARMSPEEQAHEVNQRLWANDARVRVRTSRMATKKNGAEGTVRALVTATFSPLPDSQLLRLLQAALEPVEPDLRVIRSNITERSASYVIGVGQSFCPGDDHEVGDLWGGLTVRNSGVGFAAATVIASFVRLLCRNGMTAPIPDALLFHRTHRKFDLAKLRELLIERLRILPGKLAQAANVLVQSREHRVDDAKGAFTAILRVARLPLRFLPELERAYDADLRFKDTLFGISQAVTLAAQRMSPEERFDLERAAGVYLTQNN